MTNLHFRKKPPRGAPVGIPVTDVPRRWRAACAADGFDASPEMVCDIAGGKRRVLLAGLGANPDRLAYEDAGARLAARARLAERLALDLRGLRPRAAIACLTGALLRAWQAPDYASIPDEDAPKLTRIDAVVDDTRLKERWKRHDAVLRGVALARALVTEPGNILTPDSFVARLKPLRKAGVKILVLRGDALREAGLNGLLAVGGASAHPPALVVLRWKGDFAAPPVVFAGKGITFDTGGVSIKPADLMWEMRADMAGAAACAGAMLALALRRSPAPAMAVLALAENAIGAAAYRPGDVLRSLSGLTVEVVDTDAEGRLVLMDALAWAAREKPAAIIDLATLTGSIVVALGHHMGGLFASDSALASAIAAAGAAVGERVWQMPIDASHREALNSDIADLRHCIPERFAPDSCQAAAFLREFAGDVPWAHLDIAGVEQREEADDRHAAGATGFGVRLLDRLVRDRYEDPHRG